MTEQRRYCAEAPKFCCTAQEKSGVPLSERQDSERMSAAGRSARYGLARSDLFSGHVSVKS